MRKHHALAGIMPREERLIIFSPEDILEAMKDFSNRHDRPMPRGKLESYSFVPNGEPALVLDIILPGSPIAQKVGFRHAEVAAALIMLCKEKAIPLPKTSKTLVAREGHPAFRIALD